MSKQECNCCKAEIFLLFALKFVVFILILLCKIIVLMTNYLDLPLKEQPL